MNKSKSNLIVFESQSLNTNWIFLPPNLTFWIRSWLICTAQLFSKTVWTIIDFSELNWVSMFPNETCHLAKAITFLKKKKKSILHFHVLYTPFCSYCSPNLLLAPGNGINLFFKQPCQNSWSCMLMCSCSTAWHGPNATFLVSNDLHYTSRH